MLDLVGLPLTVAEEKLKAAGVSYEVKTTRPTKKFFFVDMFALYVIKQRTDAAGVLQLIVAGKQRKEVC